ncbi:helix-turn-helix transcriptional regulator [Streptomyces sp. NPDC101209]|uniref:helix-turn-helix transcriptional regulator n=1 Tax=Streptomyces sp. NPDC101209 TaxID=3366129 RepID=UPI003818D468
MTTAVSSAGPAGDAIPTPWRRWGFLSSHARVLLAIVGNPDLRLRDVAAACHITERTTQSIITDLEQADYLSRERAGRRTQYTVNLDATPRHPAEPGLSDRALLCVLTNHAPQEGDTHTGR